MPNSSGNLRINAVLTMVLVTVCVAVEQVHADSPREIALAYYDTAEVIDVVPIVSHERISMPYEECRTEPSGRTHSRRSVVHGRWDEGSQRRGRDDRGGSAGALDGLLGALVGGAIGNQFGKGNGKRAMTVLGALAGAGIASAGSRDESVYRDVYSSRDGRHDRRQDTRHHHGDSRCRTVQRMTEVERIEGYRVTYRYLGQEFEKTTDQHPGDSLRVRVEMSPVQQSQSLMAGTSYETRH
ncbi:MAG: glycine zipper 2TM domain-containing protein [Proteobacteria bacterium]|nr:glycine zipper 2TM domain-containing protein [Pseudomonadota bacterium]